MSRRSALIRKTLVTGALVAGTGLGAAGIASAATSSSSSTSTSNGTTSTAPASAPQGTPPANGQAPNGQAPAGPLDPAAMTHGPGETPLTGAALQKAEAAAKAAVPGATVIRAETDSSGAAPYEVHMQKSDGSYVTVEIDSGFRAVRTITGFGPGPAGHTPGGAPNSAPSGAPSSATNGAPSGPPSGPAA